jgi:hypothetical protein
MRRRLLAYLLLYPAGRGWSQRTNTISVSRTQLVLGISLDAGGVQE